MQSFLIVRLGALGDIVHAMPLAAALRERWPEARVDWVVERKHLEVFDLVEGIGRVIPFRSRSVGWGEGWMGVAATLRRARYDATFDAQGLIKSGLVARLAGAGRTIGFARSALREPMASVFYTHVVDPAGRTHVIDRNLALLHAVGVTHATRRFPLKQSPACPVVRHAIEAVVAPFVLLNPGGGWPNKRWPPDRFGALAASLRERRGVRSLVLWGPGDESLVDAVVRAADGAAVRAPQTSLTDVLALARSAAVMVSGDTGPAHLAAAVGTPMVGIFGPTDPARNGSGAPLDVNVSRHHVCQCSHLRRCRAPRWCLDDVSVEEVASAVQLRLAQGR